LARDWDRFDLDLTRGCLALAGLARLFGSFTRPFRPGYHMTSFQP
jgi:hypothetical protein